MSAKPSKRPPRKAPATVTEVNAIRSPGRHSIGGGLILAVSTSGARSWLARVRDPSGRRRDIGLGPFPDVKLAEARDRAADLRRMVRDGLDPVAEKRRARRLVPTFREAARRAHAERQGTYRNAKHAAQWITSLEAHAFPKLGDRNVDQIDAAAIIHALLPIWLEIPETARRVRQRIAAVLNWAHAHGYRPTEAPMQSVSAGLPRQPKKSGRFEAMPYPELPAFVTELRGEPPTVGRMALLLTILTAARSGETRGATWDEFDLDAALWFIPGERMKAGEPHTVPLSDAAIAILQPLHEARSGDVVFPGAKGRPLSDATLSKILRDKGRPCTVHGFRSSFRDWVAETMAVPGEVAEAALAHAIPNKVEAAYRRTKYLDQRRTLMQAWANFLGGVGADVVTLKRPELAA